MCHPIVKTFLVRSRKHRSVHSLVPVEAQSEECCIAGSSTLPPPSNYVHIHRAQGELKGIISLDLSLPDSSVGPPPLPLASQNDHTRTPNLQMTAADGGVDADIYFHCSNKQLETQVLRALVVAAVNNGPIILKVHHCSRHPRPQVQIIASTTCGDVTLYLPTSFWGPIQTRTSVSAGGVHPRGVLYLPRSFHIHVPPTSSRTNIVFSEEVLRHTTIIAEDTGSGTYFIGDPHGFEATETGSWQGDMATIHVVNGTRVRIEHFHEGDASGGFLSRFGKLHGFY